MTLGSYNSLLGVEVVGEEDVVVTIGGKNFHWEDCGFKLHVPENALPEGTPEYHVNIKASLSGQFEHSGLFLTKSARQFLVLYKVSSVDGRELSCQH